MNQLEYLEMVKLIQKTSANSAFVYGTVGSMEKMSAPIASANFSATFAVVPLAEKYATKTLLMFITSFNFCILRNHFCVPADGADTPEK